MLTCKQAEKMVVPFIEYQLNEQELEDFLIHVETCPSCKEELEIYYTVSAGLKQLDSGTGAYDIAGALEESLETAWMKVRAVKLRKVICYAVNTLSATSVLTILLMQFRMWILHT
ncbi:MAG: zf-HC2 domain-containing protein [Brotaphodocola sp.]